MTRSTSLRAVMCLLATGATVALVGGTAGAKPKPPTPPKPFTTATIVVQKSVGGITLGATRASTEKTFPAEDCQSGGCSYTVKDYTVTVAFQAASAKARTTVAAIDFYSPTSAHVARTLHTDRGIGIGSTTAQVRNAYPHAGGNATDGFVIGHGDKFTRFDIAKGRVENLYLQDQPIG